MTRFAFLTPGIAVTGALRPEDFAEIAQHGFKAIVNNRRDGEEAGQLSARDEAAMAQAAGLDYRHVPVAQHELLDENASRAQAEALSSVAGPVLIHCRSGLRSTILWAAVSVEAGADLDEVVGFAKAAGFDLSGVRDELAELAAASSGRNAGAGTGAA